MSSTSVTGVVESDEREVSAGGLMEPTSRGELDVQIVTAKRFPRSIKAFMHAAMEMATLDEDTAASCFYALPRDGKTVEGPSARLAEICLSAWGNSRAQARVVAEDERFVTARGEAWDLQTNVAIGYEVKRRITTSEKRKNGQVIPAKKFSDDMVGVTGNAASSIALRNAILKIIPTSFWRPIYLECRKVAIGTAETLANRRAKMLDYFQKMGVTAERVYEVLGVGGVEDITLDHVGTLRGLATAIKDGDTTVDEAFPAKVQPASTVPEPEGFEPLLAGLQAEATKGTVALNAAFAAVPVAVRDYLTKHRNAAWEGLKTAARNADATGADDVPAV